MKNIPRLLRGMEHTTGRNRMHKKIILLLTLVAVLLAPAAAINFSGIEKIRLLTDDRLTPLNPDFIAYIKYHSIAERQSMETGGHSLGLIPTPFSLKEIFIGNEGSAFPNVSSTLTESYNITRENIKSQASFRLAPLNPEFEAFIRDRAAEKNQPVDQEGYALGLIPPLIDIGAPGSSGNADADTDSQGSSGSNAAPAGNQASYITTASSPSHFDLRTTGRLNPVRDQEGCGACWAFSTYGSLESTHLPGNRWDFSENHLKNTHGFDLSACQGGNYQMSTAYLARWSGAVSEDSDPYSTSGSISSQNAPVVQHVQDVVYLPPRTGPLDNALIKQMLQQYGALYSQIRWESGYYAKNPATYYYSGSSIPNHAVVIAGWDDTYSRNRFAVAPPGDGAFLVRNSWGDDWGDRGYFYVSYYDSWIGKPSIQYFSEDPGNYDRVYQYDPLGWVISFGSGGDTAWFANVFTATRAEELEAISFYTSVPNSEYHVEVYRDVTQSPRGQVASLVQTGSIPFAGYHTIDLTSPVTLQEGKKFSVVVRLKTPGYNYPVAIEYPYSGYSTKATARSGESWVSSDGTSWSDLSTLFPNTNACLKAFTRSSASTPVLTPTTTPTPAPTSPITITDRRPPSVSIISPKIMTSYEPGAAVLIEWSAKDNVGVAVVAVTYSVDRGATWTTLQEPAPASGTYTWTVPEGISGTVTLKITATDESGNRGSSSRSVTIKSSGSPDRSVIQRPAALMTVPTISNQVLSHSYDEMKTAAGEISRYTPVSEQIDLDSARQAALQRAL